MKDFLGESVDEMLEEFFNNPRGFLEIIAVVYVKRISAGTLERILGRF